jgi:hypothetical protein
MSALARRPFLVALVVLPFARGCSSAAEAAVYHDVGCGCCLKWIEALKADGNRKVNVIERETRADLYQRFNMAPDLASCHTAVIGGFAFEGHVPLAEVERFLTQRPAGYSGLAVPGMPMGSTGMEQGGAPDHYDVIAFGPVSSFIFASY